MRHRRKRSHSAWIPKIFAWGLERGPSPHKSRGFQVRWDRPQGGETISSQLEIHGNFFFATCGMSCDLVGSRCFSWIFSTAICPFCLGPNFCHWPGGFKRWDESLELQGTGWRGSRWKDNESGFHEYIFLCYRDIDRSDIFKRKNFFEYMGQHSLVPPFPTKWYLALVLSVLIVCVCWLVISFLTLRQPDLVLSICQIVQ